MKKYLPIIALVSCIIGYVVLGAGIFISESATNGGAREVLSPFRPGVFTQVVTFFFGATEAMTALLLKNPT